MSDQQFPAGWYEDPLGRYQQRFYDGAAWTGRVKSNEVESHDALAQTAAVPEATANISLDPEATRSIDPPRASDPGISPVVAGAPVDVSGAPSVSGFLDGLGAHASTRDHPELPSALGGLGGALASLGIIVLIGQSASRGAILGGALVALAVAAVVAFKVVDAQPWLRSASVGAAAVAFFGLAVGIIGPDTTNDNAFGLFLLIAGVLHLVAWVAPGFRGRPFMLGGGLIATAIGLAVLVAGGRCDNGFGSQCNFAEDAASQLGLSTGAGIVLLVIGIALLFAVRKLDQDNKAGLATTVAAACIVTLVFGALALSVDFGTTGNGFIIGLVGLALGIVGHLGSRRAMTWTGAALVAVGVVTLITSTVDTDSPTPSALLLILIGAILIGVPRFVQLQAATKR